MVHCFLVHFGQLWKSDGTLAEMVKNLDPTFLTNVNGTVFFRADDGTSGNELWKSDGTAAGTIRVKDINPGAGSSFPSGLTNIKGTLLFDASDGSSRQLWKSDGTAAGTVRVTNTNFTFYNGQFLGHKVNADGTLFFIADDGTNGFQWWKSDGTAAGTIMLTNINWNHFISDAHTNVNSTLFFVGDDGTSNELWKVDGTRSSSIQANKSWPKLNSW